MDEVYRAHTFLQSEGVWIARGTFWDSSGAQFPATGKSAMTHRKDEWVLEGSMVVSSEPVRTFHNRYLIEPFGIGARTTSWRSENPKMGALLGDFVLVGDTIFSRFVCAYGRHSGIESLRKIGECEYEARGAAFEGSLILSSWAMNVIRDL